jgi:hypothetical protein
MTMPARAGASSWEILKAMLGAHKIVRRKVVFSAAVLLISICVATSAVKHARAGRYPAPVIPGAAAAAGSPAKSDVGQGFISESFQQLTAIGQFLARLQSISAEVDPAQRERRLQELAESIRVGDLPDLVVFLTEPGVDETTHELWKRLVRRWAAEGNPHLAAAWALSLQADSELRREAIQSVALGWASTDERSASEWADGWVKGNERVPSLSEPSHDGRSTR